MNARIIPIWVGSAALTSLAYDAFRTAAPRDDGDHLTERARELAAQAFDDCGLAVQAWLAEPKQSADVQSIAYNAIAPHENSGHETMCAIDRLREEWIDAKADGYIESAIEEVRRDAETLDDMYAGEGR